MSFVKLHDTILDSSIWMESVETRIVWITILAMADQNGVVEASVSGLARRANVGRVQCDIALAVLLGPDSDTRDGTTGERIAKVPGGWLVLNHLTYRDRRTTAQIETAKRVAEHRTRQRIVAIGLAAVLPVVENVTGNVHSSCNDLSPSEAEADADTEAEREEKIQRQKQRAAPCSRPASVSENTWQDFKQHRNKRRAIVTERVINGLQQQADKAGWTLDKVLSECVARGWSSFKAEWVSGSATASKWGKQDKSYQHIPNMPLGHLTCSCSDCVSYREKKSAAVSHL